MNREAAISTAIKRFETRADDWSHGKPSEDDIKRMAEETAAQVGSETGHRLQVTYDEYGNPSFSSQQDN